MFDYFSDKFDSTFWILIWILSPSFTNEDLFGDATTISAALGCKNAFAFDLTAACSGFLYALTTGGQFIETGKYKKIDKLQ